MRRDNLRGHGGLFCSVAQRHQRARLRSIWWPLKIPSDSRSVLCFGPFQVDLASGELHKHGIRLRLQEQPFQILVMLLEKPGEVVTREELRTKLWSADTFVDFDVGLNNAVLRLRNALGDSADSPRFIETLPRRGYRFIARVDGPIPAELHESTRSSTAGHQEETAPAAANATAEVVVPSMERPHARKISTAGTVLAVLLALFAVLNVGGLRRRVFGRPSPPAINSLAVLPLENLSGDQAQEYFADGMTDELITDLASIARLRVISRTSTTHYKGTRKTIPEIARELNVDAVVEGSVGRSANKVRIRAQLVRAVPEEHLWAKSYERDLPDVLALQRDMAKAIADEIKIKLTPEEKSRLTNARKVDPEAYQLYLRGRFSFENWTHEAVKLARENFQKAIEKDPSYAVAYAGLADTYVFGVTGLEPKVSIPLARAAAGKALELDDRLGDAHAALAQVKFLGDWDWAGAEKEFRQAIALNPGDTLAHHMYSHFLLAMGRNEESLKESELYLQLDPLSAPANHHLAWHYLAVGLYDLAIQQDLKALEIDPNYVDSIHGLGEEYRHKGMSEEALVQYEKQMMLSGAKTDWIRSLRRAYQTERWKGYWQKSLDQDLKRANREYVSFYDIADDYALLGDKAQALRCLDKAYADHEDFLTWIKTERDFDVLHSDPRYADLLRRMGLPQ
jgi:TolB-like protein/DNA-binding winged helix-turn-helix (wHTH) protein/Tfp pilus assembly protein PilF